MNFLLYANALDPNTGRLNGLIASYFRETKKGMEVYQTVQSLSERLRQPIEDPEMAIFLASNRKDLTDILAIRHLFRDTPIILFTPDNKTETIALAHQLRPRFLSDLQADSSVVTEVLKKMVQDQK